MGDPTGDYEHRGDGDWLRDDLPEHDEAAPAGDVSRSALEESIGRAFHMRILREIAPLARLYPALPLILTENRIAIPCKAPDGFPMSIQTERGRYVVHLGDWRDELALADEAMELIASALNGDIRLRIDLDGRRQHCTAERRLPNGSWITLPHFEDADEPPPLGAPVRTIYLRNGAVIA